MINRTANASKENMPMSVTANDVLRFWFGELDDDTDVGKEQASIWWSKNPDLDRTISENYRATLEAACRGNLKDWATSARGLLALIILTDQFSRNIYRGDARAFAQDHMALAWCRDMLSTKLDQELRPVERVFAYLPLEHSEDVADQDRCVELFTALYENAPDRHKDLFESFLEFAHAHRKIITRFGRYPHRNEVLSRESTEAEKTFLTQPGSSF